MHDTNMTTNMKRLKCH